MNIKKTILTLVSAAFITVGLFADTVIVTSTNEFGPGSLGEAINIANSDVSLTRIQFNIEGGGRILSALGLPPITSEVEINGANPGGPVVIEGAVPSGPGTPVSGFRFLAGSEGSIITNVTTEGFLVVVGIEYVNNVRVFKNTFNNPLAVGIGIYDGTGNMVLENTISGAIQGVNISESTGILVENNVFDGVKQYNVITAYSKNIDIYRNTFNSGTLWVYSSSEVFIGSPSRGNKFSDNAEAAVLIRGDGNVFKINNNVFLNQKQKAVDIAGTQISNIEISLNTFVNVEEWDVQISETGGNLVIFKNIIKGNTRATYSGINVNQVTGGQIAGNLVNGGRVLIENSRDLKIGGIGVEANTFTNDPVGHSSNGALTLSDSHNNEVINNTINNNSANGIIITNESSHNSIIGNKIHDNGRTGILAYSGKGNKFSQNIIYGHHSDTYGGVNSISLTGNANNDKQPPVISSITKSDKSLLTITGIGTPGDTVEIYRSNRPGSKFSYDAIEGPLHIATVAPDSSWKVNIGVMELSELYVTAIATGNDNNSSELAEVKGIVLSNTIAGPSEVISQLPYTYSVADNQGTNFQWWVNGDASISKKDLYGNKNSAVLINFFNEPGSIVTVNVSYDHPVIGSVHKTLEVTIR